MDRFQQGSLFFVGQYSEVEAFAFVAVLTDKDPNKVSMITKLHKTEAEWRKLLTPAQFHVMRERGTEAPFSCAWEKKRQGVYHCAACGLPLFRSEEKFESGTGWPSYFNPIKPENVWERADDSHGMHRVEVLCARCDSHLGHVFDDGPAISGKRYCINSVALKFKPEK